MLQIKNTLGGGKPEGLYAWKKNSIGFIYKEVSKKKYENVYIDTTPQSGSVKVYTGSKYTFDKSTGMYTITDPYEYSVALNGATTTFTNSYLTYGSPTSANMWISGTNQGFQVYNKSSGVYLSRNNSDYVIYAYSATTEPTYTFLDYVVSDKETAYPDGGEKGGYYYEKVGVSFTELVSEIIGTDIKLVHKETVTLASNKTALPHTYGKTPSKYIVFADDGFVPRSSGYSAKMIVRGIFPSNHANGVAFTESGTLYNDVSSINFYDTNESQIQMRYSTTYMYFMANCTYTILIFE